jgi:hypothetical protein
VWSALALFSASWLVTVARVEQRASWDRALTIQLGSFLIWALLAAPVVALARRLPFAPGRRIAALALRVALAAGAALAHSALQAGLLAAGLPAELRLEGWVASFFHSIRFQLHFNLLIAALVLFADSALGWYRRSAERKLEAARLEAGLVQARLAASRVRLRPRFLFDALANVRRRLAENPLEAERLVLALAALLRAVLESWRHPDSTVRDELELARTFVEIERARLGERVALTIEAEPAALELELPSLLLVPLVDDAVARGSADGGAVALTLRAALAAEGGRLELSVTTAERTAAGRAPSDLFTEESLAVARDRLAETFGARAGPGRGVELARGDGEQRLLLHLPSAAHARGESLDPLRFREVLWSRS